jgi:hypothetical protein
MIQEDFKKRRDKLCKLMDQTHAQIREAQEFIATIPGPADYSFADLSWKRESKQLFQGKRAIESLPARARRDLVKTGALDQFIAAFLTAVEKDLGPDENRSE